MRPTRTFTAIVVASVLLLAAAPTLQARSLATPHPAPYSVGGSWMELAKPWLTGLARLGLVIAGIDGTVTGNTPAGTTSIGIHGMVPMTGPCIDPNGTNGTGTGTGTGGGGIIPCRGGI
ncbi:MAG TPA: hypothetical protein VF173_08930 [Thermoanaerobaculia bacterium]|nr:hypothetical protein [Thermoanaerobaculia bacterium]